MSSEMRPPEWGRPPARGNKRDLILYEATDRFDQNGYVRTKWSELADAVGLGSASLYHYFDSKRHLLHEIQAGALETERQKLKRLTTGRKDFGPTLPIVLNGLFDLSSYDIVRNRIVVAGEALVGVPCDSPRTEDARRQVRGIMSEIELAWATFLIRGMEQKTIPEADARLLTRAVLGIYRSIWRWYRPGGPTTLEGVRGFFVERLLATVGYDGSLVDQA